MTEVRTIREDYVKGWRIIPPLKRNHYDDKAVIVYHDEKENRDCKAPPGVESRGGIARSGHNRDHIEGRKLNGM